MIFKGLESEIGMEVTYVGHLGAITGIPRDHGKVKSVDVENQTAFVVYGARARTSSWAEHTGIFTSANSLAKGWIL